MGSGPGKDDTVEDDKVEDVEGVEEIDENGLPYFQPVDWKMLLQKRAAGTDLVAGPSDAGAME